MAPNSNGGRLVIDGVDDVSGDDIQPDGVQQPGRYLVAEPDGNPNNNNNNNRRMVWKLPMKRTVQVFPMRRKAAV